MFLNAIANQLRYPNVHTWYFMEVILHLFAESGATVREQISRWVINRLDRRLIEFSVMLERVLLQAPHPWGTLVTCLLMMKRKDFWEAEFVNSHPNVRRKISALSDLLNLDSKATGTFLRKSSPPGCCLPKSPATFGSLKESSCQSSTFWMKDQLPLFYKYISPLFSLPKCEKPHLEQIYKFIFQFNSHLLSKYTTYKNSNYCFKLKPFLLNRGVKCIFRNYCFLFKNQLPGAVVVVVMYRNRPSLYLCDYQTALNLYTDICHKFSFSLLFSTCPFEVHLRCTARTTQYMNQKT